MRKRKVYALYKGDNFVDVGTAKELAERLNKSEEEIMWLNTMCNKKRDKGNRLVAYVIEDD